ncbi:MAG: N-acetyl-gamma-glutamyl-phosphate reductase [Candidatus Thermoplasmatota archaeon]|nr:N-acetyl-gamma-glutamyl-phosphate reductase [Candidatus Thermoplasmatota archaeon]
MNTVSIIGGSGYVGGEVARLVLMRDDLELVQVTSSSTLGEHVHSAHPNLRGRTDLRFTSPDELKDVDFIFSALPHGTSDSKMKDLLSHAEHVIDTSADFRLNDPEVYRKWYGHDHASPELMESFPYGLPELHRSEIREKGRAAAPGCVATSTILGLFPFREIAQRVLVDSKIGSSAAGKTVSDSSHHPERSGVIRPYAPVDHRHRAEILQETGVDVMMTVHAVEMVRGISTTIHIEIGEKLTEKDVWGYLRSTYGKEPFIRVIRSQKGIFRYPEPKLIAGSNYCDLGFELDPNSNRLVVFSAIDNLMKGAAGSAMQCMNVIMGCDETKGLEFTGLHPI